MGDSKIASILNLIDLPMAWAEVGLWVIPIPSLDSWFLEMIVNTGEDMVEQSRTGGTGAPTAPLPLVDQGHRTPGIQSAVRGWAGEIGRNSATTPLAGGGYMPYVSHATYKVAQDWYDLELGAVGWDDNDLFDNPPPIGEYVRSAARQGFTQGSGPDTDPSAATSLADLVEQLFLLTSVEQTYADYLAAHGINPMKAAGIAQPLMLEHQFLNPMGSPQLVMGIDGTQETGFNPTYPAQRFAANDIPGMTATAVHDSAGYGVVGCRWNAHRRRNLLIEAPSILLGTITWWSEKFEDITYAHHMDMTRMTHPGHWGNRLGGGIDEDDFIATQRLGTKDGTGDQIGLEPSQSGINIMNMLNLYLHGDTFAPASGGGFHEDSTEPLRFREPGGTPLLPELADPLSRLSVQLHIMSDLVGD